MAEILTTSGGYTRITNALTGYIVQPTGTSLVPDFGVALNPYTPDTNYWGGDTGDITTSTSSNGPKVSGSNGKDHWQVNDYGTTGGCYFQDHITGFQFKADQERDGGRTLYVKRIGYTLRDLYSDITYFYDAKGIMIRTGKGIKTYTVDFDSNTMSKLESTYVFDMLRIQYSSQGGSGSRTSYVQLYNFKFKFATAPSGKQMILPPSRPKNERSQQNRIA